MKVLVTGGCGFIGSHACEFYARRGDQVVAYDNMTKYELDRTGYSVEAARDSNRDFLAGLGADIVVGDVCDYSRLLEAAQGCDFLIHTAAQPAVTISVEDPDLDFATNVAGTLNVLKTARELKIPVVSCATIHVYGNLINDELTAGETRYLREPAGIDETHPVMEGVLTPLHASKYAAELYLRVFIDTYGVKAASYRLTGLYGSRQFGGEDHGWMANFIIRALTDREINIFGTGKQVRDILYATDVAKAFHAFYENPKPGVYNIGGGEPNMISLLESIDLIAEAIGKRPKVNMAPGRHGDLHYFVCDSSKARRELGWSSAIRPAEGVRLLADWVREQIDIFQPKAEVRA